MARERFYLFYGGNAQRGVPSGRLEVYPEDIDRNFASRLYTQETPSGPMVRVPDAEARINNEVDISQLRSVIDELALLLYEHASSSQSETAPLVDGLAAIISDELPAYSQQLAAGKMTNARQTLESMSQKLIAAVRRPNTPDPIDKDKLFNDTAQTLSVEIETGLSLYEQLEELQKQFDSLRREVVKAASTWSVSDEDTSVRNHLAWLADDTTGLKARMSVFFLTPTAGQESAIQELHDEAYQHLGALQGLIKHAETARQQMRDRAQPVLDLVTKAARLTTQLQKVKETILMLPSDTVSEVVSRSELLTASELERWNRYGTHQFFGNLERVRAHFANEAERIRRRLDDAPHLSDGAMAVIAEARRSLERLQSRLEMSLTPAQTVVPEISLPSAARTSAPQKTGMAAQCENVSQERLDEIYQLAIAVASYKYCSHLHFVGMTVRSVLGILVLLGKVSGEERTSYQEALSKKIESRSVTVTNNLKVRDLWERTNPQTHDWIHFKPKNRWLWRLVQKAQLPGQYLAQCFGLTQEAVEKAFNDQRNNRDEQYQDRKKKKER